MTTENKSLHTASDESQLSSICTTNREKDARGEKWVGIRGANSLSNFSLGKKVRNWN